MRRPEIVERIKQEAQKMKPRAQTIIAPFYSIELDFGIIISTLVMPRKEWENRPFPTPFYYNVTKEGITL